MAVILDDKAQKVFDKMKEDVSKQHAKALALYKKEVISAVKNFNFESIPDLVISPKVLKVLIKSLVNEF